MNPQIAIPLLAGLSVMMVGGAVVLWYATRRAPLKRRLQAASASPAYLPVVEPEAPVPGPKMAGLLANLGTFISAGKSSKSLSEQLTQAGFHHTDAAAAYLGCKMLLVLVGLAVAWILLLPLSMAHQSKMILIGAVGMLFFMLPNMVVSSRRTARRREIRSHLPEAIDLLEVCASSGMGLDMAWNSVADEIRHVSETLADEMALTNLEIQLGAARTTSMRHMASRTGAEELSSMVAVLVQSERFGTSISEALQTFATFLRESSGQAAQESAEKMAVKLIFPMVVCIFPSIVAIMIGPAFISLYHALQRH
jgi:tight adherence protein C